MMTPECSKAKGTDKGLSM